MLGRIAGLAFGHKSRGEQNGRVRTASTDGRTQVAARRSAQADRRAKVHEGLVPIVRLAIRQRIGSDQLELVASNALPDGQAYDWHQALMDLGASVCLSRSPRCDLCPAIGACCAHPAILFAPRLVAERKASYTPEHFETTNRYFRGRAIDALRQRSPLPVEELGAKLGRADGEWLKRLIGGLESD